MKMGRYHLTVLKEMGCESVDWLLLYQDRDQLPDLGNTVMNFGFEEICCQAVRLLPSLEGLKGKVTPVLN
jgi:hypothetical protein